MSVEANQSAKITLYWLDKSRSQRILWLLEELKVDYDLNIFKRGKDLFAPPELKDVHPLGKSPLIGIQTADAAKPMIIAESGLIVEYLTEYFGKWMIPKRYPDGKEGQIGAETEQWLRYRFLMHYAEGSFMTIMLVGLMTHNIRNAPVPFFIKPITKGVAAKIEGSFVSPNLKTHLDFLEDQLATTPGGGEFFCGKELTGADIMMIFPLEAAVQKAPMNETTYPKLYAWVRRMQARAAYKLAGEKASEASGERYVPISEIKM
ncbi:glutathione transferase [Glonium stellatum]|uniref:Glutathione transferase n=1 Tax=Glonium stellatum TaxID=574774 RepID=A0A8E2F683_9PEZI|nr:glutathione transferase [Glonium stellatum]